MQNYVLLFRKLVRARVNKGTETECISLFFKAHLQFNVHLQLCFKEIDKDYERFLVKSKKKTMFDVSVALGNSCGFVVHLYRKMGFEGLHDSCSHVCRFYLGSIGGFNFLFVFIGTMVQRITDI